jgi:hypothetical protein
VKSKRPSGSLAAQIEQLKVELAHAVRLIAGQRQLQFEDVGGDAAGDNVDDVIEEDDAESYDEDEPRRRQSSTVGSPRTHGYYGQPLSAEDLRREIAKKDLQRALRQRGL